MQIDPRFTQYNLTFDKDRHIYYLDNQPCKSVTQVITSFRRPFDTQKVAARCAAKESREPYEIIREWDVKRNRSLRIGTRTHEAIEDYFNSPALKRLEKSTFDFLTERPWTRRFLAFANYWEANYKIGAPTSELRVVSPDWLIAGTIDLLVQKPDGHYKIIDWKTNAEIKMRGYGKLYHPLNKMDDCDYHVYRMQLNTYAYILEAHYGCQIDDLELVHLKADTTFETHHIPLNPELTEKMLTKWRSKNGRGVQSRA